MKVILDTNVVISGIFFSGPPHEILKAWQRGLITLVVSPSIQDEYERVGLELKKIYSAIEIVPFLELLYLQAEIVAAPPLSERVCTDEDDDKFLACALKSRTKIIVSGDKALRRTSGYQGISVLNAREFVDKYLSSDFKR